MTNRFAAILLGLCINCTSLVYAENTQNFSQLLSQNVSVSGQMTTAKFDQLMRQGFKSVIVNRPDEDAGNQVSISQLRTIAERSHVSVIYQPVDSGKVSQSDVTEFAKYYNHLPKPILLVCRSGSRSTALFNQAKSQGLLNE